MKIRTTDANPVESIKYQERRIDDEQRINEPVEVPPDENLGPPRKLRVLVPVA